MDFTQDTLLLESGLFKDHSSCPGYSITFYCSLQDCLASIPNKAAWVLSILRLRPNVDPIQRLREAKIHGVKEEGDTSIEYGSKTLCHIAKMQMRDHGFGAKSRKSLSFRREAYSNSLIELCNELERIQCIFVAHNRKETTPARISLSARQCIRQDNAIKATFHKDQHWTESLSYFDADRCKI